MDTPGEERHQSFVHGVTSSSSSPHVGSDDDVLLFIGTRFSNLYTAEVSSGYTSTCVCLLLQDLLYSCVLGKVCVYYCRTYYKAVCGGGGGQ